MSAAGGRTRLILLPGLGADQRLFAAQRSAFPDLEVPAWLAPTARESLPAYGQRMAAAIGGEGRFVLGGVSFGGMVAVEMARHCRPDGVVLIASARSAAGIPRRLRALAVPGRCLPPWFWSPPRLLAPLAAPFFGGRDAESRALFTAMLMDAAPAFIRWAVLAVAAWGREELPACRIHQLHGAADRVLPARRSGAAEIVPGAGHLVNVTHAETVNGFLRRAMVG